MVSIMALGYRRARLNRQVDLLALLMGLLAFGTGLVLFFRFHVGPGGATRAWGLGLSRIAWVNIHRLSALVLVGALVIHGVLHWRAILLRLSKLVRPGPRMSRADPFLYFGIAIVVLTAVTAWLFLPGSPPLTGPTALSPPPPLRHRAIDLHNIAGFVTLAAASIHIRRHADWLFRHRTVSAPPVPPVPPVPPIPLGSPTNTIDRRMQRLAPDVDRARCEGGFHGACARAGMPCVSACRRGVLVIQPLSADEKRLMSLPQRLRAWIHRNKQVHVVNPTDCVACGRCVRACPTGRVLSLKQR